MVDATVLFVIPKHNRNFVLDNASFLKRLDAACTSKVSKSLVRASRVTAWPYNATDAGT